MKSANRIIAMFVLLFTVGLLVAFLIPSAISSTRAAQAAPRITKFNGLEEGQTLSGRVVIETVVAGSNINRVVFQLDGPQSKKSTDRSSPYFFRGDTNGVPNGWNTAQHPDGDYTLTATTTNTAGQRGALTAHFRIANHAPTQPTAQPSPITQPAPTAQPTVPPTTPAGPTVSGFKGVQQSQAISGMVAIEALVSGENITQVAFQLDGPQPMTHVEKNPPYYILGDNNGTPNQWDTTQYPNGDYTLTAMASNTTGQSSELTVHFRIANIPQTQPTTTIQPTPSTVPTAQSLPTAEPTAVPTAKPVPTVQPEPPANCGISLQQLINSAVAGATVQPPACIYRETITIDKPITLDGSVGAEIRGSDIWRDWSQQGDVWISNNKVPSFSTAGECAPESDGRCLWPEQVFLDERPLYQVSGSPEPASLP